MRLLGRLAVWWCFPACLVFGQNLVPNSSFEAGIGSPTSWTLYSLADGEGQWENFGLNGSHCVSVTGDGTLCPRYWKTTECAVEPGRPYQVQFMGRATNATVGICMSGFDVARRDSGRLGSEWAPYSYIVAIPNDATNPVLRFGQCQINGTLYFDQAEVWPVLPVYTDIGGLRLGEGESVTPGFYWCTTRYDGFSGNFSRCLYEHTAKFAEDGWQVDATHYVTYRHGFPGLNFTNVNFWVSFKQQVGTLYVDMSTNGTSWQVAGSFTAPVPGTLVNVLAPTNLLPATTMFVRLRSTDFFWITGYWFQAGLPQNHAQGSGQTWFFRQIQPGSSAVPLTMANTPQGLVLTVELRNSTATTQHLSVQADVTGVGDPQMQQVQSTVSGLTTNLVQLLLPSAGAGTNTARLQVEDLDLHAVLVQGSIDFTVSKFMDTGFGQMLPSPAGCPVWWCDASYKVFPGRGLPVRTNTQVEISAARNEYEPFQIVLRPQTTLSNAQISLGDFAFMDGPGVQPIRATNAEICRVEYVPVKEASDPATEFGLYPDPLVPPAGSFNVAAGSNQPIWVTVRVPKDASAGSYQATLTIESDAVTIPVTVRLRVFDFTLSDVTHTKTGYGLVFNTFWHPTNDLVNERILWEYYMENFRKHRISAMRPQSYARIKYTYAGPQGYTYDFEDFDAFMERYMEEFNFTAFNWDEERSSGTVTLNGYERFSAEYCALYSQLMPPILAHLREKGWLEKAYSFWFDEPKQKDYPLLIQGMQFIQQAAPGLRRWLSTYPDPPLYECVDIWSPLLATTTLELSQARWAERQLNGEEIWWYVAPYPYFPVPNNFTEQPGYFPRLRGWMAEKFGVQGEAYWQVSWLYGTGFKPWNPWTNAMCYSGFGDRWGNGDGLLLYPSTKTLPPTPVIAPPINSSRWEMLREAQEDREYFWLLNELIARAERRLGTQHPSVQQGRAAREAALALIKSQAVYEQNPQKFYDARLQLAAAIQLLDDGSPMIVRHPKSQAVALGSNVVLRAEALGRPAPTLQWQLNGVNLPGATGDTLNLSNLNETQLGEYRVWASNAAGTALSSVGRLSGKWLPSPQILAQPQSVARKAGSSAVFAVTAVSSLPLGYQWCFGASPLPGSTNATLLLTNLIPTQAGSYVAVVSNAAGVVTSATATLTVPVLLTNFTLISTGSVWRYNDLGANLGTNWYGTNYDDSAWKSGPAQLGYGDGDEQTVVGFGPDPSNKFITTYFRRAFQNPFSSMPNTLLARMLRDDGAVGYLNETETYHSMNMPDTSLMTYISPARGTYDANRVEGTAETTFYPLATPLGALRPGTNIFAAEVHQYSPDDPDLSFDFELVGSWALPPVILTSPAAAARRVGQAATFSVSVASAVPMTYRWFFNGTLIPWATNASFTLAGLQTNQFGNYSVEVSNAVGSVVSTPVGLVLASLPALQISLAPPGMGIRLVLPPDSAPLTVQSSTDLTNWKSLYTRPPSEQYLIFLDLTAFQSPRRYYRLRVEQ